MGSLSKFTHGQVLTQIRHAAREIRNSSNKDIDPARSNLNYSLAPLRLRKDGDRLHGISPYDYYKERKSQVYIYGRKDVVTLCCWIITSPKTIPQNQQELFFKETHKFLANRYGEKNIVNSVVHLDETTPHLHFQFSPIIPDLKRGGEKFCANDLITRHELKTFHPDLIKHLTAARIEGASGILNGATSAGNRTVKEMKREREQERSRDIERGVFR